jgi:hypothetical protein
MEHDARSGGTDDGATVEERVEADEPGRVSPQTMRGLRVHGRVDAPTGNLHHHQRGDESPPLLHGAHHHE